MSIFSQVLPQELGNCCLNLAYSVAERLPACCSADSLLESAWTLILSAFMMTSDFIYNIKRMEMIPCWQHARLDWALDERSCLVSCRFGVLR